MTYAQSKFDNPQTEKESAERAAFVAALPAGSHIHISGVCGTGMASVLALLKQLGFRVSGSDKSFYPPMGDVVRKLCDKLFEGYDAANLAERPALVVIGNSISRNNPEAEEVLRANIPFASMPEVFSALLIGTREHCPTSIVVCGTHGKSTTSAAMAFMLEAAGRKPGYFVGGLPQDLPGSIRAVDQSTVLKNRVVVLEGDEYDSAYFAKWSKFHSYRPDIAIVTSLEFDHADIFENIEQIEAEFTHFVRQVPKGGLILVCDFSPRLRALAESWAKNPEVQAEVLFYGESTKCAFQLSKRNPLPGGGQKLEFILAETAVTATSPLSGPHNALNLLAVASVAARVGLKMPDITNGIAGFHGVLRRQDVIAELGGITVIEDFAHHPTAVRVTLQGLRENFPDKRLVAVFEPRSNTSRRSLFKDDYARSFSTADEVILLEVGNQPIYSGTAAPVVLLDVKELAAAINSEKTPTRSFSAVKDIENYLATSAQSGDLIVLMSNGDFGGLPKSLPAALAEKYRAKV